MKQYLELYRNSQNPLKDDEVLEKIVNAYIRKAKFGGESLYREIEKIGTEEKTTTPPPSKEKDKFWSVLFNMWKRNILNDNEKINSERYDGHLEELVMSLKEISNISTYDELCIIVEKYPVISEYGIMPKGDRLWNFVLSRNVSGIKENDINPNYRLYINSEASDTYQIVAGFISKCFQNNLPYYLKFIEYAPDYKDRADSIVIWADEKTLFQYIAILEELEEEIPSIISRCKEPAILTMKINDWIGFGEEPKDGSYTSARIKLLMNSIDSAIRQWIVENQDKRLKYKNANFSVKQYITARSVKEEFNIIKREIIRNPKASIGYGVKINELNSDLYIELCNELLNEVIPAIESNNSTLKYKQNGKKMSFDFENSIYELLEMILHSDTERANIFKIIRENIKLNSKQYGIDAKKFIFNEDYLERIRKSQDNERE